MLNVQPEGKGHPYWWTIEQAKHQYRTKIESYYTGSDARRMWQGLQTITDYKGKHSWELPSDTSLPDELNNFYARFEASNTETCMRAWSRSPQSLWVRPLNRSIFTRPTGPDGLPGRVLRACADQLARVFTDIFNLSLSESVILTCFKQTTIVPVPKHTKVNCLNDYQPVALTSVVMSARYPRNPRRTQFAYHTNRFTDDAISITLHTALSHMDKRNLSVSLGPRGL
jgi:hypothetical protein